MTRPRAEVTRRRPAGPDHDVVSVEGGGGGYRRSPCGGCPWRVDQTGVFPAEAFRHSAETAYDMATRSFGCHESALEQPLTCAGFLLNGADHHLTVRTKLLSGAVDLDAVHDGGHDLHPSYRAMAEANGVHPDDPRLTPCRDPYPRDEGR